ncbi:hypothetical protein GJ744_009619 [Endocarpon pusillum]|uniref:Early meiotic induction protein 1 n=1 Tax=Endocarpon pusillum TaxID=364733 RepID=A0A8H7AHM8_9EURO|nr:hypothetical protein GJ744_009619 [Endocarpon pusillum]
MGWWWSSGTSKGPPSTSAVPSNSVNDGLRSSPPSAPQFEATQKPQPSKVLTRDEEGEQELADWLKKLDSESTQSTSSKQSSDPVIRNPDISPDSLYPREISCRSAFDYAFFCQTFGGQFVNVYRYGTFRSCSNHWQDFWLCMRTRQWEKEDREKAIADHYRKKAIKYKQGPSSEDVWEMRTEPVKDAFQGDLEALEREVAEWRRQNPGSKEPWEQ